jgi:hypothetical protein
MRRYESFLVRWWQTERDEQRVSIRHVQSDEDLTVVDLPDAFAWMATRTGSGDRAPPVGAQSLDGDRSDPAYPRHDPRVEEEHR